MKKIIKLTKIKDLRFNNNHPNDINEGSIHIGLWVRNPKIEERFFIDFYSHQYHQRGLVTSVVEKIIDENTFQTKNSIYKWELITESDADKYKNE